MKSASQLRYIESARFGNQLTRRAKAKKRAPNSGRAERMDQTGQKKNNQYSRASSKYWTTTADRGGGDEGF